MDVGCSQCLKQLRSSSTALIKDTLSPCVIKKKRRTRLCFIQILEMVYVFLNYLFFRRVYLLRGNTFPGQAR